MIFSYQTKNDGPAFVQHTSEAEAIRYLLDMLGPNYEDKFWLAHEPGPVLRRSSRNFFDFTIEVCPSLSAAVALIEDGDPGCVAADLRALAQAVEAYALADA